MEDGKKTFYLKWPWSLLVVVALFAALYCCMGLLAAVPVAALAWWNGRRRPGMPAEGYCLRRSRGQLSRLLWAGLSLLTGAAMAAYFWYGLRQPGPREARDWVLLAVAAALGAAALLGGAWWAYTGVRDALFPERSALARSIRSQLPYPDEAPPVAELFAMVDRDIQANGQWFDRVAVGKEWVLGDGASYIPRIRAVFGRDEVQHHHANGRTTTTRIVQLCILDDRRQVQITSLRDPRELPMLLTCLELRAPDALFPPYAQYTDYLSMDDDAWERLERDYRSRQARRTAAQVPPPEAQDMVLTLPSGEATSRVTADLVRQTLADALRTPGAVFTLAPSRPLEGRGARWAWLRCMVDGDAKVCLAAAMAPQGAGTAPQEGRLLPCDRQRAEAVLLGWLRGEVPNMSDWMPVDIRTFSPQAPQEEDHPPQLALVSASGAAQTHQRFHREDVEVAGEGIVDGTYRQVDLTRGYLWMRLEAGDQSDGRCTVTATRPDGAELRCLTAKCAPRQAAAWLLGYWDGSFLPGGADWKDITRKMNR